tara:strand:+ start:35208 stop:37118 length:1911 start_codon:yes stop_codon:yes gene_type:complete
MSFSLDTLTEGIKARNVGQGNRRLLEKWGRTGLLRGLEATNRENMATLLENQAGQALREASALAGGANSDIRGFTNIAFPIVRRVFGSLIANELVSIQPMSLPSGLLFYLDYTYGSGVGADGSLTENAYDAGQSIYGLPTNPGKNGPAQAVGGQYDLAGSGYSRPHKKLTAAAMNDVEATVAFKPGTQLSNTDAVSASKLVSADSAWISYDPQIQALIDAGGDAGNFGLLSIPIAVFADADLDLIREIAFWEHDDDGTDFYVNVDASIQGGEGIFNVRRLTRLLKGTLAEIQAASSPADLLCGKAEATHVLLVVKLGAAATQFTAADFGDGANAEYGLSFVEKAGTNQNDLSSVVSPAFESAFKVSDGDGNDVSGIPEIDIKIESVSVVAQTRKLKAKWSPELAQDLNAYHSLDAEVELTQILSEQVALEIDREILGDLLMNAGAANFFWSRSPGNFVNKRSGAAVSRATSLRPGPAFTGTVREWYETLVETIIDVSNEIHRKTLRGAGNFIVVSPEVATILEASVLYKPALSLDSDGQVASPMVLGAEKVGTLSSRFTVYKDPYFPRHKILVGFKGSSYLETGYVYAPYVPLIVTPTIFAPEDFTPRKGVMTRYGKKMVRSDFYGTVTCLDMNVI